MTQHFPLDYTDPVHEGFFDPIQELLGTYTGLRVYVVNSTTLGITAGTGNSQVAVTISSGDASEAGFRYITSNITAALPGGLTSGTGSVYVTASDNDFTGTTSDPDSGTVYSFAMEILASGTPTTDLYRKVGEVDVTGSAITAFRPMGGPRTTSEYPLMGTSDNATQAALVARGAGSQSANIFDVQSSAGSSYLSVGSSGTLTSTAGITVSSSNGITISADGGNDTLNLSNTASGVGITIGADTTLYREAANELRTDDKLSIKRGATDVAFATQVGTEAHHRLSLTTNGQLSIGGGSAAADTYLYRKSGGSGLVIDSDGSGGAATLSVSGNVGFNGATPTSPNSWTVSNKTNDRSFDANSVTLNELADVVASIVEDLDRAGLVDATFS